jgi:hypothetical protein
MEIWPTPRPAVKAAVSILQTAFGSTAVSTRMPRTRPTQIVLVSRVGGGQDNPRMDRARLLIECWAGGPGDAETMTGQARAALRNAGASTVLDDVFVYAWENEEGPVMYDDPDVPDMVRHQFTGDLLVSTR